MLNNLPSLRVVALRPQIARIAIVVDVVVWVVEMGVIVALIWFKGPVSVSARTDRERLWSDRVSLK